MVSWGNNQSRCFLFRYISDHNVSCYKLPRYEQINFSYCKIWKQRLKNELIVDIYWNPMSPEKLLTSLRVSEIESLLLKVNLPIFIKSYRFENKSCLLIEQHAWNCKILRFLKSSKLHCWGDIILENNVIFCISFKAILHETK